jgi:hypothetical protein
MGIWQRLLGSFYPKGDSAEEQIYMQGYWFGHKWGMRYGFIFGMMAGMTLEMIWWAWKLW